MESIKQKPVLPLRRQCLPDFRNLGVLLRTLLLVNVLAVLTAIIAESEPGALGDAVIIMVGRVELPLFLLVLLFYAAGPQLAALPYRVAVAAVLCTVAVVSLGLFQLLAMPADVPWRWLLWSLGAAVATLAYFDHIARRLTPSLIEARLMALTARIRPHFLYNALNGVLGVIRSDPRRAERALEELAELFRALMRDNRGLVSLGEELTLCRRYLDIESLRLGDRLNVRWDLAERIDDARVPPLMLQPLLENAIYHGIEPLAEPGEVVVRILRRGGEVVIEVDNPVPEAQHAHDGNHMALDNIRERLMLFFDLEARMESTAGQGRHRVEISLPYRRETDAGQDAAADRDR